MNFIAKNFSTLDGILAKFLDKIQIFKQGISRKSIFLSFISI